MRKGLLILLVGLVAQTTLATDYLLPGGVGDGGSHRSGDGTTYAPDGTTTAYWDGVWFPGVELGQTWYDASNQLSVGSVGFTPQPAPTPGYYDISVKVYNNVGKVTQDSAYWRDSTCKGWQKFNPDGGGSWVMLATQHYVGSNFSIEFRELERLVNYGHIEIDSVRLTPSTAPSSAQALTLYYNPVFGLAPTACDVTLSGTPSIRTAWVYGLSGSQTLTFAAAGSGAEPEFQSTGTTRITLNGPIPQGSYSVKAVLAKNANFSTFNIRDSKSSFIPRIDCSTWDNYVQRTVTLIATIAISSNDTYWLEFDDTYPDNYAFGFIDQIILGPAETPVPVERVFVLPGGTGAGPTSTRSGDGTLYSPEGTTTGLPVQGTPGAGYWVAPWAPGVEFGACFNYTTDVYGRYSVGSVGFTPAVSLTEGYYDISLKWSDAAVSSAGKVYWRDSMCMGWQKFPVPVNGWSTLTTNHFVPGTNYFIELRELNTGNWACIDADQLKFTPSTPGTPAPLTLYYNPVFGLAPTACDVQISDSNCAASVDVAPSGAPLFIFSANNIAAADHWYDSVGTAALKLNGPIPSGVYSVKGVMAKTGGLNSITVTDNKGNSKVINSSGWGNTWHETTIFGHVEISGDYILHLEDNVTGGYAYGMIDQIILGPADPGPGCTPLFGVTFPADIYQDCIVNIQDFAVLALNWLGSGSNVLGDINTDASVNLKDVKFITDEWLLCNDPESNCSDFYCGDPNLDSAGKVNYIATQTTSSMVLDGNLNEWPAFDYDQNNWCVESKWVPLNKTYYGSIIDAQNAYMCLMYDPATDVLYGAVTVDDYDGSYWSCQSGTFGYDTDFIEIYVQGDTNNNGDPFTSNWTMAQQYEAGLCDNYTGSYIVWADGIAFGSHSGEAGSPGSQIVVKRTLGSGYLEKMVYEFKVLPYNTYGGVAGGATTRTDLYSGKKIGFDVVLNVNSPSSGVLGMLCANSSTGKSANTRAFATVTCK